MGNLIKLKIGISLFSISILVLIPLLESNFNAPVTIKRWSKLTWDDFQGIARPFNRYDAAISSNVYLEYDSLASGYRAYAGQSNVRSWARKSTPSDYLLNHEQYHFNITELHARDLNNYIKENPKESEDFYLTRLWSMEWDLEEMQRQYDSETNHGTIYDKQRSWEYKIDSLLTLDSGWVTDYFSGAKAYFPAKPVLTKGITENEYRYRTYSLNRYAMTLSLSSYQNESINNTIQNVLKVYSKKIRFISFDSLNHEKKAFMILKDSSNYTMYSLWLSNEAYVYSISAAYPNNTGDTTGYSLIARSFINSFNIVDTDTFWINKQKKSNSATTHSNISKVKKPDDNNFERCLSVGKSKPRGFYKKPFFRDDGALLLPYDIIEHADSLLYENILLINTDLYSYPLESTEQIYFVPKEKLPKTKYRLDFGYLLKKDSTAECYKFYYQSLEISSFNSKERSDY